MKLKAPKGISSFSHDGVEYEVKKGVIDVEGEAYAIAQVMGFSVPSAKAPAEEEQTEDTEQTQEQATEQAEQTQDQPQE